MLPNSTKKIHEGKNSIVWLGEKNGQPVVIKQLHPHWENDPYHLQQFRKEAEIKEVPNVTPRIYDYVAQNNHHYIVKEYIEGVSLKSLHQKFRRKRNHPAYFHLYSDLMEKINLLHQSGIIHGDIKPSNILLKGDFKYGKGEVRLLDLGLAFDLHQLPTKNYDYPLSFSMLYSAPELMLNEPGFVSVQTDYFSLGICMYESFSGDQPYKEGHAAILLQMMLAVPLSQPKRIPKNIFDLIQQLTIKPGFKRPISKYTAEEVRMMLKENIEIRKSEFEEGTVLQKWKAIN